MALVDPAWMDQSGTSDRPATPELDAAPVLNSRTSVHDVVVVGLSDDGQSAATESVRVTLEFVEEPRRASSDLETDAAPAPVSSDRLLYRPLLGDLELVIVAATVYDHSRTLLNVFPNGSPESAVSAWTNLNFNHFIGATKYLSTDSNGTVRAHSLLLSVINIDTAKQRRLYTEQSQEYSPPDIPSLPDLDLSGPSFKVLDGDLGVRAKEVVQEMHDLYREEGDRMEEAFLGRQLDEVAAAEEGLTRPATPRDVTIRFWKRTSSDPTRP